MTRQHYLAMASMLLLGLPAHAQNRPPAPRGPAPTVTPAPPVEAAPPGTPIVTVAMTESMRRREERSVDLEDLLAQVSASTGKTFLVDPRVRARVYGVPKIDNPSYAELLSILRMHGYVAVEIEGRVNIVPDAVARFLPSRLLQRDDDSVPDDEMVTRVIEVPNAPQ